MRLGQLLLLLLVSSCRRDDSASAAADADTQDTLPDSAVSADDQLTPGYRVPHPGSWDSTRLADAGAFSLTVPAVADARWSDPDSPANRRFRVAELPECSWPCVVTIATYQDSLRRGLIQWTRDVFRMDAPVDTSDFNPRPTFLTPVMIGSETALHLSLYCGGCTTEALVTGRRGHVAVIEYSLDDRDANNAALRAHLLAVSRSFRWKPD